MADAALGCSRPLFAQAPFSSHKVRSALPAGFARPVPASREVRTGGLRPCLLPRSEPSLRGRASF